MHIIYAVSNSSITASGLADLPQVSPDAQPSPARASSSCSTVAVDC